MILLLIFNFLVSVIYILNKKLCFVAAPTLLSALRFFIAGAIFYIIQPLKFKVFKEFVKKNWSIIGSIIIGFAGGDILRTYALKIIPSSHASLLATTSPFIALITSYFMLNEVVTTRKILGLLIGVGGLLPLLIRNMSYVGNSCDFIISYAVFICSLFLFVIGGIYSKKISLKGYSLSSTLAAVMMGSGIGGFCIAFISGACTVQTYYALLDAGLLILALIVFQNILGFYLYNYLLKYNSVTLVTFSNLLIPLFTAIILWWYQIEVLDYNFLFAFCMLIIAFMIFMLPVKNK